MIPVVRLISSISPATPWEITDRERDLTEESLVQMFSRYVNVLSDEPIEVGSQDVKNGG